MGPHPPPPGWYPDPRGTPGQAYWDGQRWQFPPAPRNKARLKTIAIVCGVILTAVVLAVLSSLGHMAIQKSKSRQNAIQSSQPTAVPAPQQPSQVKLNQEARDGNLAFVVTSVDTAQQTVDVHMTIKNVGNRPAVFWADNQRMWIGSRWFVPDKAAANKAGASSVKLDPGKSVTVVLSFDAPSGTTAVDTIELHDAAVSAGITVVPRP
jgi:archaellum component FlaG (FlaF/FlaG flagellin family)